ncbi:MAG: TIGR03088 family PEP-CTERM/XrtA system glycosyltransferase [Burkholderiaceae bacterium]
MTARDPRPLIAHVLYRFDVGGLEQGVVNLINRLPRDRWRHAVVALTEITSFRERVMTDDVEFIGLHKRPGHGFWLAPRLFRTFRRLNPDVVHTRNLAALEAQMPAALAGVKARVHGEHGWDMADLHGTDRGHALTRRAYRPFVSRWIALSTHLAEYLRTRTGVAPDSIVQIYNGVDTQRFLPIAERRAIEGCPFSDGSLVLIGTVGRLERVKNQALLLRALAFLRTMDSDLGSRVRLVIVGNGSQRATLDELARQLGVGALVWWAGERRDVLPILQGLDIFVLPSLAEGISNTVLEAMATGLATVATAVGGNPELIRDNETGRLVGSDDPAAMGAVIMQLARNAEARRKLGVEARAEVERRFSLDRMVNEYEAVYNDVLAQRQRPALRAESMR